MGNKKNLRRGKRPSRSKLKHLYQERLKLSALSTKAETSEEKSQKDTVPNNKKIVECKVCHLRFQRNYNLLRHSSRFSELKYPCDVCGTKFSHREQLALHKSFVDIKNPKTNCPRCPICTQIFIFGTGLQSHLYHFHKGWDENIPKNIVSDIIAGRTDGCFIKVHGKIPINGESNNSKLRQTTLLQYPHLFNISNTTVNEAKTGASKNDEISKEYKQPIKLRERNATPFVTKYPAPSQVLLNKLNLDVSKEKKKSSRGSEGSEETEKHCSPRITTNNIRTQPDAGKSDEGPAVCDSICAMRRRNNSDYLVHLTDIYKRDKQLQQLYSCKECYVSLPRIDVTKLTRIRREKTEAVDIPEIHSEQCYEIKSETDNCVENSSEQHKDVYHYNVKIVEDDLTIVKSEEFDNDVPEPSSRIPEVAAERTQTENISLSIVSCFLCDETFPSDHDKKVHVLECHTVLSSVICNKHFLNKDALLQHYRRTHLIYVSSNGYCMCGKELTARGALEKHFYPDGEPIRQFVKDPANQPLVCVPFEKNYSCPKCDKKFWLRSCLVEHRSECISLSRICVTKNLKEGHLKKYYNWKDRLSKRLHETAKMHTTKSVQQDYMELADVNRKNVCRICNASFQSKGTLLWHEKKYIGNERHECSTCGTVFPNWRLLKSHVQATHDPESKTTHAFFCDICNQGFSQKLFKRMHTMHFHRNQVLEKSSESTIDIAPVSAASGNQCSVCNLAFVSRKRYIEHTIYYDKNNIIECKICGKGMDGQYSVHHHNKKVHYSRAMQHAYIHHCTICKEGFLYKSHLHAHIFHVHDDQLDKKTSTDQSVGNQSELQVANLQTGLSQNTPTIRTNRSHRIECGQTQTTVVTNKIDRGAKHSAIATSSYANIASGSTGLATNVEMEKTKRLGSVSTANNKSRGDKTGMKCETCGFCSSDPAGLATHTAVYSNSGYYMCEICGRRFTWPRLYSDHRAKHFEPESNSLYVCLTCDEGFETIQTMKMHVVHLHRQSLNVEQTDDIENSADINLELMTAVDSRSRGRSDLNLSPNESNIVTEYDTPQLHTEIFEDDLSVSYECPHCKEKYFTIDRLQEHITSVHKSDPNQYRGLGDTSTSSQGSARCSDAVIKSRRLLNTHREEVHSTRVIGKEKHQTHIRENDQQVDRQGSPQKKQDSSGGNRFYVVNGANIRLDNMDTIMRNMVNSGTTSRLFDSVYRYDVSFTCDICNLTFGNDDLLNIHRNIIHMVRRNAPIADTCAQQPNPPGAVITKIQSKNLPTQIRLSNGNIRKIVFLPIGSFSSTQSILEKSQSVDKVSSKMNQGKSDSGIPNVIQFESDKNLGEVHQVTVHCLNSSVQQPIEPRAGSSKDNVSSSNSGIQGLRRLVGRLPRNPANLNDTTRQLDTAQVQCKYDFEMVMTPAPDDEITILTDHISNNNIGSPTPMNPPLTSKSNRLPNEPLNVAKASPGDSKIGKLKVRPFAKIADNFVKESSLGKRQDECPINLMPMEKRQKRVFDHNAYRELCRQHNLHPASKSKRQ